MTRLSVTRAGPMATVQDAGRFGALRHGISASGPMDGGAFRLAGAALDRAGEAGIEFSQVFAASVDEDVLVSAAGGRFQLWINGAEAGWPGVHRLAAGDSFEIAPGPAGNYGYLRFDREIEVPLVLGSRSTNVMVGLGGFGGRALRAGDVLELATSALRPPDGGVIEPKDGAIRVMWGLHADLFGARVRERFATEGFFVTSGLDRMGVRLTDASGVFSGARRLNLVSDAIVPGDIQILGDGVPVVLMRDHQPTGGYPRIATVVSADLDRFAQLRPGAQVQFTPVTLEHAR